MLWREEAVLDLIGLGKPQNGGGKVTVHSEMLVSTVHKKLLRQNTIETISRRNRSSFTQASEFLLKQSSFISCPNEASYR